METNEQKLESIMETVIAIPFGGSDDESDFEDDIDDEETPGYNFSCKAYTPPELASRDLPDGPRLRMKLYEAAFDHCMERIQEVLRRIHAPTIKRIIDIVNYAYNFTEEDRLMPYTELRAVAISGTDRSATMSILNEVRRVLVDSDSEENASMVWKHDSPRLERPVIMSTLSSTDCSNLTSAMKAVISGFLDNITASTDGNENEGWKQAFAPYDINLLVSRYEKLRRTQEETNAPKLIILVPDLEKIEPGIIEDVFYICSSHVPRLPFVFVLGLSTPPSPSYVHSVFSRKTLALLQLTRIEAASGMGVLTRILKDTFFHPEFEPEVIPSPAALSFISEQYTRTVQSMDFVVSLLQLLYLRHFTDPLSALVHDETLGTASIEEAAEKLSAPSGRPFFRALLARLHHRCEKGNASEPLADGVTDHEISAEETPRWSRGKVKGKEKANDTNEVGTDVVAALGALKRVQKIRHKHRDRMLRSRIVYLLVSEIRKHLDEEKRIQITERDRGRKGEVAGTEIELMCAWLRGTAPAKEGKALLRGIQLMADSREFRHLLLALKKVLDDLPEDTISKAAGERKLIEDWNNRIESVKSESESDAEIDKGATINEEMQKWLKDCIRENTYDFTDSELWDLWYTGNPTGISEILNPAPRAAIINALVHPERYLGYKDAFFSETSSSAKGKRERREDGADGKELLMPDIALLFKGYLESGRMVNVYDWYTSFKENLDGRRRSEHRAIEVTSHQRTRGKKGRQKAAKRSGLANGSRPSNPKIGRGRPRGGRGGRGAKGRRERSESDPGDVDGADENEMGDEQDLSPEERERWESEVQARFIRAMQELDLLGFVKHTGRKADHVQRTVYELADYA